MANVFGTSGNDFFHVSGDGRSPPPGYNDITDLTNGGDRIGSGEGGDDIVYAGSGDDVIIFGPYLTAADQIDGGTGFNGLNIGDTTGHDYSGGNALVFSSTTFVNVQWLALLGGTPAGYVYDLTTNDANVAAGQTLVVSGGVPGDNRYLSHGNNYTLMFNGSAESDGRFDIHGGSGSDTITGGDGSDIIREVIGGGPHTGRHGGNDAVSGGGGDDLFIFKDTYTAADSIDGGSGHDRVTLNGAYDGGLITTPTLVMDATTMTNVENLTLHAGFDYTITTNNATVAAGAQLLVDATSLGAGDVLTFNGSAEADGHFVLRGGAANDVLTGGLQGDTLTGNGGADHFTYSNVAQSASTLYDRITDFNAASDKFDLNVGVTGIDTTQTGHLSVSTLDANLAAAFTSSTLAAHHAALFTATSGGLSGHTFLVVDANGTAGYDAHADYVFDVTGITNAGSLTTGDFI